MSADLSSRGAKGLLRERAYENLQKYGPGVVCIFMNTEDRARWENEYGEYLDPGVEGVPLVDDPRPPQNRANLVYQSDFENWKQGIRGRQEGNYVSTRAKGHGRRPSNRQSETFSPTSD